MLHDLSLGVALAFVTLAALFDHQTGRIPNWLTFGALAGALVAGAAARLMLEAPSASSALSGAGSALLGALLVSGGPLALYVGSRGRHLGGGDVKLLAALGAWLGPTIALESTALSLLGLLVFVLTNRRRTSVRLGPALAAGTWVRCVVVPGVALLGGLS